MLLSIIFIGSCSLRSITPDSSYSEIISKDRVWSGKVIVDGVVLVRKGATLNISPGATIFFTDRRIHSLDEHEGFTGSGLKIEGRLLAKGTKDKPIRFTSASKSAPSAWDRIYFVFSKGNVFEHCIVEFGRYAIHSHFSTIRIADSLFRGNVEGVRLGSSRVIISDSVFTGNRVRGINFKDSRNEIRGCAIYRNGVGIFLHSKDSASVIRGNAIYDNELYELRLGDLHESDIDVRENFWGEREEESIGKKIYDGRDQEGIGRAAYTPFLLKTGVNVSGVRGFCVHEKKQIPCIVFALKNLRKGFIDSDVLAKASSGKSENFNLDLPPGRYFIYGRGGNGKLFGFTGNNPLRLKPFSKELVVIPMTGLPGNEEDVECGSNNPGKLKVKVIRGGKGVAGASVYAYRVGSLDIRGPGEAAGITSRDGATRLSLKPGEYMVVARKRRKGGSLGMVRSGGMFGIYPFGPLKISRGCTTSISLPVFVKEGVLEEEEGSAGEIAEKRAFAFLKGEAARGYRIYFYRGGQPVGRPVFRSSVIDSNGTFSPPEPGVLDEGNYFAFIKKATPGEPGSEEKIEGGPIPVVFRQGAIAPSILEF